MTTVDSTFMRGGGLSKVSIRVFPCTAYFNWTKECRLLANYPADQVTYRHRLQELQVNQHLNIEIRPLESVLGMIQEVVLSGYSGCGSFRNKAGGVRTHKAHRLPSRSRYPVMNWNILAGFGKSIGSNEQTLLPGSCPV